MKFHNDDVNVVNHRNRHDISGIDNAIIDALSSPSEKKAVADLEDFVIQFIEDTQRDLLEFSPHLGTYQVR